MLEMKKTVIAVKFDGKDYELRKCSTVAAKELFKKMKQLDENKDVDKIIDLQEQMLLSCGATKELIAELDFEQFGVLAETVMGVKKN